MDQAQGIDSRILARAIVCVAFIVAIITPITYIALNSTSVPETEQSTTFDPFIETSGCSNCYPSEAIKYEINYDDDPPTLTYIQDVTSIVRWRDGYYVKFDNNYLVKVTFNKDLENGSTIRLYARYGTTPAIKAVVVETTDWTVVGGGEVYPQWNYYDLLIDDLAIPTNVFYIAINPDNPSSNDMRINQIKCYPAVHVPAWHDSESGLPITEYTFNVNYLVTTDGNVDDSEVYVDIVLVQEITNQVTDAVIVASTLIEQDLLHVTVDIPGSYISRSLYIISRAAAGTNNVTITLDIRVTAYGKIDADGGSDWVVLTETFDEVRSFTAWWY